MQIDHRESFDKLKAIVKNDNVQQYREWYQETHAKLMANIPTAREYDRKYQIAFHQLSKMLQKLIDTDGKSLAHIIAANNSLNLMRYIIQEKYVILQHDDLGATPMHEASYNGHVPMVVLLQENGLRVSDLDQDGCQVLHAAAKGGQREVIDYIVNTIARDEKCYHVLDGKGASMMHHAAENGHLELMLHLQSCKIPLTACDGDGVTPLHYACAGGKLSVIKYLLQTTQSQLADRDHHGLNAFHYLAMNQHGQIIRAIMNDPAFVQYFHKDDLLVACENDFLPIHHAAMSGSVDTVNSFLFALVPINAVGGTGQTCLHLACEKAHEELVSFLIERGADKLALDDDGCNAWFYATGSGKEQFLSYMEKQRIPICENKYGRNPMFIAVQTGRLKVVKKLEELGVELNNKNKDLLKHLKKLAEDSAELEYIKGDNKREEGVQDICKYLDSKMQKKRLQYHSTGSLVSIRFIDKEGESKPLKPQIPQKRERAERSHSCVRVLFGNIRDNSPTTMLKKAKTAEVIDVDALSATLPLSSLE